MSTEDDGTTSGRPAPLELARGTARRIEDAAIHLFSTRGFEATGIRELATESGVTSATLYHHVGGKADLLERLMRTGYAWMDWCARRTLEDAEADDAVGRVARLVAAHVTIHALHPARCRVVDTEFRSLTGEVLAEMRERRAAYEQMWVAAVRDAADAGALDVADVRLATRAVLEMCTGVSHWFRADGPLDVAKVADAHVRLALLALGAGVEAADAAPRDVPDLPDVAATDEVDA